MIKTDRCQCPLSANTLINLSLFLPPLPTRSLTGGSPKMLQRPTAGADGTRGVHLVGAVVAADVGRVGLLSVGHQGQAGPEDQHYPAGLWSVRPQKGVARGRFSLLQPVCADPRPGPDHPDLCRCPSREERLCVQRAPYRDNSPQTRPHTGTASVLAQI